MRVTYAILEGATLVALTFWTLHYVAGSTDFLDGIAGVLVGILALWGIAWGVPDGLSFFDRSIERRKRVFERPD